MGLWTDIVGSVRGYIRLGLTGVRLKNSSGALAVRNAGDSAYAGVECGAHKLAGLQQLDYSTDIASGATVDLGTATGNSVTVTHSTGTTAITSFGGAATVQKGGIVAVIPSISGGTLTVTHHATNMILLGGANITLASGDVLFMMKNHDSNAEWKHVGGWRADGSSWAVPPSQAEAEAGTATTPRPWTAERVKQAIAAQASGKIVQVVEATPYTEYNSSTVAMPFDDSIPQNTEGTEWVTVSITPTNASNRLVIEADMPVVAGNTSIACQAAIFKDSIANALAATTNRSFGEAYGSFSMHVRHEMAAGTTSATTFKLRAGSHDGSTMYVNGNNSTRKFGGISAIRIRVTEIEL